MLRLRFHLCRLAIIALLPLLIPMPVSMGWQTQSSGETPRIEPGQIELAVSRVYTFVDKTGLGHQHAIEGKLKSGKLILNSQQQAGELVFDMDSFDADTAQARRFLGLEGSTSEGTRLQVNQNMRGPEILDVARHPKATFVVKSSLLTGRKDSQNRPECELVGDFTLHGVSKPLRFFANIDKGRGWLRLTGKFAIEQTNFGIKPYSKAFGAVGIKNELQIHGVIWLAPSSDLDLSTIPEFR